jgi:hypothetical protein
MIKIGIFKRLVGCLLLVFLLSGCTTLLAPSRVQDYCKRISGSDNLKSSVVRTCMDQEITAKKKLSTMEIQWQVEKYCREISEQTGGSYQVMLTCVEEEQKE